MNGVRYCAQLNDYLIFIFSRKILTSMPPWMNRSSPPCDIIVSRWGRCSLGYSHYSASYSSCVKIQPFSECFKQCQGTDKLGNEYPNNAVAVSQWLIYTLINSDLGNKRFLILLLRRFPKLDGMSYRLCVRVKRTASAVHSGSMSEWCVRYQMLYRSGIELQCHWLAYKRIVCYAELCMTIYKWHTYRPISSQFFPYIFPCLTKRKSWS
jgi:hypothetical protein